MNFFFLVLKQTVTHAFRKGGGAMGTVGFYIVIITLFGFALGPDGLSIHASAVMCTAMLLSSLIALPLMYERDYEDGTLEQLLLAPVVLEVLVLAKICGHWLGIALPVLLASPLMMVMTDMPFHYALPIIFSLLLASPSMVAIGSIGGALTLGTKRGGLLQALIVLPLYIPLLIFTAAADSEYSALILAAILCAVIPLSCVASAALIRAAEE